MRSGGALPLPKAQTGIPSVARANQQAIQNAGTPYLNRAMVQAILANANQPVTNTLGQVISTPTSREQERREKVVANDPSQYSIEDYKRGIQEPGVDNNVLADPIAMAAALTAGSVGLGATALSQVPRMFLGNLASEATVGLTDVGKYYLKGLKKIAPEKEFTIGKYKHHLGNELKKTALAFSPSTTKAIGRLDDTIAKKMLEGYRYGEYSSVKDFRIAVKKATLESERLKKIYPDVNFGKMEDSDFLLRDPKNLKNYAEVQSVMDKTKNSQKKLMTYIDKGYTEKMNLINQDEVFKNIANESPQYTDLIYEHLKNPKVSNDEFVNNLVKQSNTFTRSVTKPTSVDELLTIKGRSMSKGNQNTMDVEGFPVSGEYGDYRYKIEPNVERMAEISALPIEKRWAQRFPENFSGNNQNINLSEGWHAKTNQIYNDWYRKRMNRNRSVNDAPIIKQAVPENAPIKYYHYPQHSIFSSELDNEMLKGFDVSKIDISEGDALKYIQGFTRGFSLGGVKETGALQQKKQGGETNISKAVINNKEMRLLDKDGNPIYQNTPNTGKFILYSPSTKKAQFTYINTGKSGVDKINAFLNKNKDAQYIHLDNGRYEYYGVNPEGLTDQDFKNYYEQDLERKGNPGYNLIIKKNGGSSKNIVVSDLWKQVTGSDWSQAKKLGLTDGSYEQNIALREKLISSLNNQPAEKPQLNISSKAKPRVTPSIQRVAVNPMVQDASVVRPSNQQLAYEYYKTQPFGLTDPYSTVPLDIQYAMMQSASRQDKVYQTPTGLRAGTQAILNDINQPTNNDLVNTVSNFITYPVQAGVNIANTIAGDTPIRSDADVENLAWDATAVLPYARGLKNLTDKGIRGAAYRGIEPFDYGIVDKIKNFFPNLIGNTLDPTRQLRNITEKYKSTGVSAKKAERLGKNMLDSWATGLKIPQKYNTLKKVGDNTYRIANSKIQTDRLKNIWKEVNRYKRNSPNQQLITHASKDPKFSHSVYDFDSENALMGQYRWDVKKLSDGNIHFKSFDKYDLHPFGKRGAIFAKPESWVDEWRSKYFNKNLQDFEALGAIGGKPYNVENNYIFNPKTNKIVKKFNEGGVTYKVKINKPK
jgi:hypothetical protein